MTVPRVRFACVENGGTSQMPAGLGVDISDQHPQQLTEGAREPD